MCLHGDLCLQLLVPDYVAEFQLGRVYLEKRHVIDVVCVRNCMDGVSSASFPSQLETAVFHFINRRSKHVVQTDG